MMTYAHLVKIDLDGGTQKRIYLDFVTSTLQNIGIVTDSNTGNIILIGISGYDSYIEIITLTSDLLQVSNTYRGH